MKERSILFSGPMVRAILDGRKTQTRRAVKPQPKEGGSGMISVPGEWAWEYPRSGGYCVTNNPKGPEGWEEYCPYGAPGDRLWVRETLIKKTSAYNPRGGIAYDADGHFVMGGPGYIDTGWRKDGSRHIQGGPWTWQRNTLPSTRMPRWASRLTLEITRVRVERLQAISVEDAVAEGISAGWRQVKNSSGEPRESYPITAREAYADLWDRINGKGSWAANPWVWVVAFKYLEDGNVSR